MNENDKILINAYLDGETSEDESKYIESLLKTNNEANDFANNIKRANTEINSYFNSSESKDLEINIDAFIEEDLLKQNSNGSFLSFLNKLISNYAITATLFFAVGLSFNQIYQFSENQMNFTDSVVQLTIRKTRSSSNSYEFNLKTLLETMVKEKKINGELMFDNKISYVKFTDKALSEDNYYCFEGNLVKETSNQIFLFCSSLKGNTLLYLDN